MQCSDLSISMDSTIPVAVHDGMIRILEANPTLDHDRLIAIALCQYILLLSPSLEITQTYLSLISGSKNEAKQNSQ